MHARLVAAIGALAVLMLSGHEAVVTRSAAATALETEARGVAVELFRSINERRYERSCALMVGSRTDRANCMIGLRVGLMWSQEVRFRVTGVRLEGDRAIVSALADGVPGRIVLVRVGGLFRVLRLVGA